MGSLECEGEVAMVEFHYLTLKATDDTLRVLST